MSSRSSGRRSSKGRGHRRDRSMRVRKSPARRSPGPPTPVSRPYKVISAPAVGPALKAEALENLSWEFAARGASEVAIIEGVLVAEFDYLGPSANMAARGVFGLVWGLQETSLIQVEVGGSGRRRPKMTLLPRESPETASSGAAA